MCLLNSKAIQNDRQAWCLKEDCEPGDKVFRDRGRTGSRGGCKFHLRVEVSCFGMVEHIAAWFS